MNWNTRSVATLKTDLVAVEAEISEARARQSVLVNELDRAQAPQTDGSRSMVEWLQSHLDIDIRTARNLLLVGRRIAHHRYLSFRLADGHATFPRTIATLKYAETGASHDDVVASFDRDIDGVTRLTARRRHITPRDEQHTFEGRHFTIQPTLDESSYRMWGQLPGMMGRTLEKALHQRADELPQLPLDARSSRGQRQADALVAIAQDSLDGTTSDANTNTGASVPHVTVFVDASDADIDPVDTAQVAYGPKVGPAALEQILCTGRIQIVGLDNGTPVVSSRATRAIPRAIRHAVMHRDGGCTIDGCRSTYRLEPHHITPWSHGGDHSVDNLTTLCWYHHHVAVHGEGYQIDPRSPPLRRRLTRIAVPTGADPP